MITDFLLGVSTDPEISTSDSTGWTDRFAAEFNTAFEWISKRERFKIFYWMVDGLEFRKSCSAAKRLVDELIRRAMELRKTKEIGGASETYVALEPLLCREQDPKPIRDQYMNLILAGKDSSGALLAWVFYAFAREPLLAADLIQEIDHVLGFDESRVPNKTELNSMLKLDRFVCESEFQVIYTGRCDWRLTRSSVALRLFPPVPLNGRFATEDTFLPRGGGNSGEDPILVPKGTLVAFSTFAVHRNRDLYGQDAGKFRPDRWEDDVIKQRRMVDWSYHPFFGGPRKCLGGKSNRTPHVGRWIVLTLLCLQNDMP
jgi:cytochrome P450